MVYPSTDTVRNLVTDNVRSTLAAISAGGSYRNTMARVFVAGILPQSVFEFPFAIIVPTDAQHDDGRLGMVSTRLGFVVHLRLRDLGDEALAHTGIEAMHDLVEDVRAALLADHTRGGYAVDTHVTTDSIYPANTTVPAYAADVTVSIDYRVSRSSSGIDPGTAV